MILWPEIKRDHGIESYVPDPFDISSAGPLFALVDCELTN